MIDTIKNVLDAYPFSHALKIVKKILEQNYQYKIYIDDCILTLKLCINDFEDYSKHPYPHVFAYDKKHNIFTIITPLYAEIYTNNPNMFIEILKSKRFKERKMRREHKKLLSIVSERIREVKEKTIEENLSRLLV